MEVQRRHVLGDFGGGLRHSNPVLHGVPFCVVPGLGKLESGRAWQYRWCRGPESNWLRPPFQGGALPVSYPGTVESVNFRGASTECQMKAVAIRELPHRAPGEFEPAQSNTAPPVTLEA